MLASHSDSLPVLGPRSTMEGPSSVRALLFYRARSRHNPLVESEGPFHETSAAGRADARDSVSVARSEERFESLRLDDRRNRELCRVARDTCLRGGRPLV